MKAKCKPSNVHPFPRPISDPARAKAVKASRQAAEKNECITQTICFTPQCRRRAQERSLMQSGRAITAVSYEKSLLAAVKREFAA